MKKATLVEANAIEAKLAKWREQRGLIEKMWGASVVGRYYTWMGFWANVEFDDSDDRDMVIAVKAVILKMLDKKIEYYGKRLEEL